MFLPVGMGSEQHIEIYTRKMFASDEVTLSKKIAVKIAEKNGLLRDQLDRGLVFGRHCLAVDGMPAGMTMADLGRGLRNFLSDPGRLRTPNLFQGIYLIGANKDGSADVQFFNKRALGKLAKLEQRLARRELRSAASGRDQPLNALERERLVRQRELAHRLDLRRQRELATIVGAVGLQALSRSQEGYGLSR